MSKNSITVIKNVQIEQTIKKSRFICRLIPVETETAAKKLLEEITKKESKANHNCYAYILGNDSNIQRASDDGEPSGTAGVPMLEVLKKEELTNVLAIVTRYFGGIKLGAGGLIRAYGSSVSLAVSDASLARLVLQQIMLVTIDYKNIDTLNYFLQQQNLTTLNSQYSTQVTLSVPILKDNILNFKEQLTGLLNGNVSFKNGPEQIIPIQI
ncbi:YigZ family protein [Pediococcus claussenii]|uniref:YigZ family protein n=1 Tax=Pediococcus claussenii (strain ATCC BAA-344 / DSM 14800 / JCM 18046 / KCTC 3811 / LMG 21948 / P06) TaxID=701521 RepID=G8PBZ8_PEDCP|nr:YigZ family protein [Pediococcus claussenii]AEV94817.1 hypothetical protein PECL_516 [Pediococcus claussenii ATCC BAA-344]ANZ70014.1 hypothetical protein AYR57_06660 [Pediococcus claussenii]ANZ71829.1 hypothetical protein AYR58_06660 [Pediococcus claussenii]KRN20996.1 hypothetical protein IV79_GL000221 [Pediococcus claussenii]